MRDIWIDLYKIKKPYSGLGQFSIQFARALSDAREPDWKVTFLVPKGASMGFKSRANERTWNLWNRFAPYPFGKGDVWHSLQQFPSHKPARSATRILTTHDLNFLLEKTPGKARKYLNRLQKNVNESNVLTAISEHTKSQMEAHLDLKGRPIHVIYNGVALQAYPQAPKPGFLDDRPYFFSLGIFNEKKNFDALVDLMNHFQGHVLVLAGDHNTKYGNRIKALIASGNLSDRIVLPGTVTSAEKYWLYKHARAFLFPSLAEGFGLPVIEAMATGTPVFLSNKTSLPEVGGDIAHYFTDFGPESMKRVICAGLDSADGSPEAFVRHSKAHAARFTWEKAIQAYISLYRQL